MFIEFVSKISFLVICVTCASVYSQVPYLDGRIVGGLVTTINKIPWQVSLQLRGQHFCGGSIVARQWIATAAHCTKAVNNAASSIKIRVGSSEHNQGGEIFAVKRIIQNEHFSSITVDYDFALLELTEPIHFDESKQAIQLHNFDEVFADDTKCLISGWGTTQNYTESNLELRAAIVPLVNQNKCRSAYKWLSTITPRMICAGIYEEGGKDACQGDSGGPLVAFIDGSPRLIGIVSWGFGCAKPSYPGIYSRISAAHEWLIEKAGLDY